MEGTTNCPNGSIDYGCMMQSACSGLVGRVLEDVAKMGLPGEHYFFIRFDTKHPGVVVPPSLMLFYPIQMTIVLQHYFKTLYVDEDGFTLTLNFDDRDEAIHIPFRAIKYFDDPSVDLTRIMLKFEVKRDLLHKYLEGIHVANLLD